MFVQDELKGLRMRTGCKLTVLLLCVVSSLFSQDVELSGGVTDPLGKAVAGANVHLDKKRVETARTKSNGEGRLAFHDILPGDYTLRAEAHGFADISRDVRLPTGQTEGAGLQFGRIADQQQSIVTTAKSLEPAIDLRNTEVFNRTLFTRDNQVLQQLNAGINAGQHEGGGKSLEIRRFGFNLDHGGVNGGLKVLVDDVQQKSRHARARAGLSGLSQSA